MSARYPLAVGEACSLQTASAATSPAASRAAVPFLNRSFLHFNSHKLQSTCIICYSAVARHVMMCIQCSTVSRQSRFSMPGTRLSHV